jgi:hypothetical protein
MLDTIGVPRSKAVFAFLGVVAIFHLYALEAYLSRGVEFIVWVLTTDDTFYYLQAAWNAKRLGFVTVDGLHATNGVQILWFALLYLLAWGASSKAQLLIFSIAANFLLNVSCYLIFWKIGETLRRPRFSLYLAAFWSMVIFSYGTYWRGMENSLHALVFWCVLWRLLVFMLRLRQGTPVCLTSLTALLVLNVWARVDSIFYSALIYIWCVVALYRHAGSLSSVWTRYDLGRSLAVGVSGLGAMLLSYWLIGGTVLPISALVKLSWHSEWWWTIWKAATAFVYSIPRVLPYSLYSWTGIGVLGAGGLVLFSIVVIKPARLRAFSSIELSAFRDVTAYLLLCVLSYYLTIVVFRLHYHHGNTWHRSVEHIAWICLFVSVIHIVDIAMERWLTIRKLEGVVHSVLPILSVLVIGISSFLCPARSLGRPNTDNGAYQTYLAARWVARNLPLDATIAAWNSGVVGYWSDRTVINLDGLANGVEYYRDVLRGDVSLMDYLHEHNVGYIIDGPGRDFTDGLAVAHVFPPSGADRSRMHVWKVPSKPTDTAGVHHIKQ